MLSLSLNDCAALMFCFRFKDENQLRSSSQNAVVEQALSALLPNVSFIQTQTDVGVAQLDGIRVDTKSTIDKLHAFWTRFDDIVAMLTQAGREFGADCVVFDISALGPAVAKRLNVPSIGISNFDWHYIYEQLIDFDQREKTRFHTSCFVDNNSLLFTLVRVFEFCKHASHTVQKHRLFRLSTRPVSDAFVCALSIENRRFHWSSIDSISRVTSKGAIRRMIVNVSSLSHQYREIKLLDFKDNERVLFFTFGGHAAIKAFSTDNNNAITTDGGNGNGSDNTVWKLVVVDASPLRPDERASDVQQRAGTASNPITTLRLAALRQLYEIRFVDVVNVNMVFFVRELRFMC